MNNNSMDDNLDRQIIAEANDLYARQVSIEDMGRKIGCFVLMIIVGAVLFGMGLAIYAGAL